MGHATEEHCDLAGMRLEVLDTIAHPERIFEGRDGELFAVRELETGKWLVGVYREIGNDGFLITAFLTKRIPSFERRKRVWPV